jgi:hypothetical protein
MQGLPPENMEGSQPMPTSSPEESPQQSEVEDVTTPQVERTDSLERFQITNSREEFRIHSDSERRIMRVNSFGDLVVLSSGSPNGPFLGPEGQVPFWSTGVFRWDLFGSGAGVEITVSPAFPKTSDPDKIPFTTAYYFPSTKSLQADDVLTIPLEMVHYTDTMSIHTGITIASQAPIGTLLSPSVTPTLPPRYCALNSSIPTPTQTPSETPGGPSSSGHSPHGFILTLSQPPFGGHFQSSIGDTNPSATILSFTPNYHIPIGGEFHQGGLTQPPLVG